MRQLVLAVLMCSAAAIAQPKDGGACLPNARFHLQFDRVELIKVLQTLSDATCKPVVLGPGVEAVRITLVTPENQSYTAEEFAKLVTVAAETSGASIVESKGVIRVTLKKEPRP